MKGELETPVALKERVGCAVARCRALYMLMIRTFGLYTTVYHLRTFNVDDSKSLLRDYAWSSTRDEET
jgi:hypothetical protein